MIKLISKGKYQLVSTRDGVRILYLDDQSYLWIYVKGIGDLLVFSRHSHKSQYLIAQGSYKIYDVKNESRYVDLEHLELYVGQGAKQGYLLLTGLPTMHKIRSKIIPTDKIINIKNDENK